MTDSQVVHTNSLRTYICTLSQDSEPKYKCTLTKESCKTSHECSQLCTGDGDTAHPRRQSPAFPLRLLSFLQLLDAAEDAMSVTEGRDAEVIPQLLVAEAQ